MPSENPKLLWCCLLSLTTRGAPPLPPVSFCDSGVWADHLSWWNRPPVSQITWTLCPSAPVFRRSNCREEISKEIRTSWGVPGNLLLMRGLLNWMTPRDLSRIRDLACPWPSPISEPVISGPGPLIGASFRIKRQVRSVDGSLPPVRPSAPLHVLPAPVSHPDEAQPASCSTRRPELLLQ